MKEIVEHSFGIIPVCFPEGIYHFFLVRHLNGNHWGFPKGHREKGESPKQAAERELFEETKMRILRYLPYPYLVDEYRYQKEGKKNFYLKQVRFYLAEVTASYSLQKEEIVEGRWILLKNIFNYVTFESQRLFYQKLIDLIQ